MIKREDTAYYSGDYVNDYPYKAEKDSKNNDRHSYSN